MKTVILIIIVAIIAFFALRSVIRSCKGEGCNCGDSGKCSSGGCSCGSHKHDEKEHGCNCGHHRK